MKLHIRPGAGSREKEFALELIPDRLGLSLRVVHPNGTPICGSVMFTMKTDGTVLRQSAFDRDNVTDFQTNAWNQIVIKDN